jgi:hypothetical protein
VILRVEERSVVVAAHIGVVAVSAAFGLVEGSSFAESR